MYKPAVLTVPPDVDQITAVLLVPDTYAVNCCWLPVCKLVEVGDTETETEVDTVTTAAADLVGSATLVAVTVYVPADEGAV